ncbi:MAG: histone deacetylase family protein [Gammaproteobacteria bacterium]
MFRIRKIHDDTNVNKASLAQVQAILRTQFQALDEADIVKLPQQLKSPHKHRFRAILFVAEDARAQVLGFALVLHDPELHFCYLDFLSAARGGTGGGTGGALYQRVREESRSLEAKGLFFECLPDDPELSPDDKIRAQNVARLKFYEHYGARPIANTAYETPLREGVTDPPYLVFDGLGGKAPLRRVYARSVVRAILERKYGKICPPEYIDKVINSFRDDPVQLRPPRYEPKAAAGPAQGAPVRARPIALIVNDKHSIHHVRERGYVQAPARIDSIIKEIDATSLFEHLPARHFALDYIKAVHDKDYVDYLKNACARMPEGKSVYPYVFPLRNHARVPEDLPLRAGYYCIDTFTPLNQNAYKAAIGAVDCALTGAECLLQGYTLAYALVRPPGHHAERDSFGGFCYFNSSAVAAHQLSHYGRVAVLDVDYHHGNGTQDIFYDRADVLTVSVHGHPRVSYPYFSGFDDEKGEGVGRGFNVNIPLPEGLDGEKFREALSKALARIRKFNPAYLVLALGLDTARGDPTGSFTLRAKDFQLNGRMIGGLRLPTLVVQEGGYRTRSLGVNARHFFLGLAEAEQPALLTRAAAHAKV